MPLDPLAKRLLTMMAAAAPQARSRPSVEARRQSLAKLMQFARADAPDVTTSDGVLPGPGGALPYRLYSPAGADDREERDLKDDHRDQELDEPEPVVRLQPTAHPVLRSSSV